ncbi:MAG: hypothetical protein IKA79_03890 [Lentisphaeria bacterium]|nr:hypothetical protein [Lentisphaeria bacterium]
MMISMKVAGFIRMDWEKTVSQKTPRIRVWKSDVYQSGKRPLVSSPYTRIGFLCGGQQIPDFMLYAGYPVDYYVFDKGFTVPDRYEVAGKIIWDGKEVFIYKKASEQ